MHVTSIGVQASANLAPLALDINEYKGLGAVAFPVMAKLNFGALSGFSSKLTGGYLGGGLQWSRTELFGLNSKHRNVERIFTAARLENWDLVAVLAD